MSLIQGAKCPQTGCNVSKWQEFDEIQQTRTFKWDHESNIEQKHSPLFGNNALMRVSLGHFSDNFETQGENSQF